MDVPKDAGSHANNTISQAREQYDYRRTVPVRAAPVRAAPAAPAAPTAPDRPSNRPVFAHYVAQNYKTLRSQLGGHGDTMKALSQQYRSNN